MIKNNTGRASRFDVELAGVGKWRIFFKSVKNTVHFLYVSICSIYFLDRAAAPLRPGGLDQDERRLIFFSRQARLLLCLRDSTALRGARIREMG